MGGVVLQVALKLKGEGVGVLLVLGQEEAEERPLDPTKAISPDSEEEANTGRWAYRDVHAVVKGQSLALSIWLLGVHGARTKVKEKMKGWGSGEMASNYLSEKEFTCESEEQRDDICRVLRRLVVDSWQRLFESEAIKAPEIYQHHLFLTKRNRKGKLQIRFFVMSDTKMYNMEARISGKARVEVGRCKWAFPISDLLKVTTYVNEQIALSLTVDTQHAEMKRIKDSVTYLVDSQAERDSFIREMKRLYLANTQTHLQVEVSNTKGTPEIEE